MDGETAVVYARTRMADGDRWRRSRHAQLIRALVAAGLRLLRSPRRWGAIVRSVRRALTVEGTLPDLGLVALTGARNRGHMDTVPVVPPVVRSVRLERGWFHVADPDVLAEVVQHRFVAGEADSAWTSGDVDGPHDRPVTGSAVRGSTHAGPEPEHPALAPGL